jgi:hypothetical protein
MIEGPKSGLDGHFFLALNIAASKTPASSSAGSIKLFVRFAAARKLPVATGFMLRANSRPKRRDATARKGFL